MKQNPLEENRGNEKEPEIVLILKEPMMAKEIFEVQTFIQNKPDFSVQDIEGLGFTKSQKNLLNQYLEAKKDPHGIDPDYIQPEEESGIIGSGRDQMSEEDFSNFASGCVNSKEEWGAGRRIIFPNK